ncbi:TPA: phosphotransferase family protein, partial [Acinetobacter baumannii]|nr:phosphotransferase family protein [Acinetobacter baumannii]
MSVIDVGGEVREGEELDIGAVENWLKNQGVELVGPAVVTQYTGGASNWTYRLKY